MLLLLLACMNVKVARLALVRHLTHAAVAGIADTWLS